MSQDLSRIKGPKLVLRLITTDDAPYVHSLRVNPELSTHLSEVCGTIEDQRTWINSYKTRERVGKELYYVITHHGGIPCGTVRLYDINSCSFTWGSWILDHNKPSKAALESAVLSFGVGFEKLGTELANIDVRCGNTRAIDFYRRFGMIETHRIAQTIFFNYERARFLADKNSYHQILKKLT